MDVRERIILYASERFFREGFSKVTMDEIASELKISKKTLYKHFASKSNIVHTIIADSISNIQKSITESVSGNFDAITKLKSYSHVLTEKLKRIEGNWLKDIQLKEPQIFHEIQCFRENFINKNLKLTIVQGIEEGLIKNYPPNLIIQIFLSTIREIINPDFLLQNNIVPKDAIEKLLDILFGGILTKKGRKNYKNLKAFK